jgi:hypothetical protein
MNLSAVRTIVQAGWLKEMIETEPMLQDEFKGTYTGNLVVNKLINVTRVLHPFRPISKFSFTVLDAIPTGDSDESTVKKIL